jgi:hypothetical protein
MNRVDHLERLWQAADTDVASRIEVTQQALKRAGFDGDIHHAATQDVHSQVAYELNMPHTDTFAFETVRDATRWLMLSKATLSDDTAQQPTSEAEQTQPDRERILGGIQAASLLLNMGHAATHHIYAHLGQRTMREPLRIAGIKPWEAEQDAATKVLLNGIDTRINEIGGQPAGNTTVCSIPIRIYDGGHAMLGETDDSVVETWELMRERHDDRKVYTIATTDKIYVAQEDVVGVSIRKGDLLDETAEWQPVPNGELLEVVGIVQPKPPKFATIRPLINR